MINQAPSRDKPEVASAPLPRGIETAPPAPGALVREHFRYVWRLLRRLGLPEADADDAAQQAFITALAREKEIEPGRERAFLYGIAMNLAARHRRKVSRLVESLSPDDDRTRPGENGVDELVDQRRARELLDEILSRLPDELREVLVLYEIEELSAAEIAGILQVPNGTVASRLRRAREAFSAEVRRIEARARFSAERAKKERA